MTGYDEFAYITTAIQMINGEHMEWDLYYYIAGKKPPPEELIELSVFKLLKAFVDERKRRY